MAKFTETELRYVKWNTRESLDSLGTNYSKVAETLALKNIEGDKTQYGSPISVFLQTRLSPTFGIYTSSKTVLICFSDGPSVTIELPESVIQFLEAFHSGEFPYLNRFIKPSVMARKLKYEEKQKKPGPLIKTQTYIFATANALYMEYIQELVVNACKLLGTNSLEVANELHSRGYKGHKSPSIESPLDNFLRRFLVQTDVVSVSTKPVIITVSIGDSAVVLVKDRIPSGTKAFIEDMYAGAYPYLFKEPYPYHVG